MLIKIFTTFEHLRFVIGIDHRIGPRVFTSDLSSILIQESGASIDGEDRKFFEHVRWE